MRKSLLTCTALLGLCTGAVAADAVVRPAPVRAVAVDPFVGWFIGPELGYGWGKLDFTSPIPDPSPSGFLAGGSLGYRSAVAQGWYLGLFSSIDYLGGSDSKQIAKSVALTGSNRWIGATQLQVGYLVMPGLLLYGQGGLAYGSSKARLNIGSFSASDTERGVGWAAGGGIEYSLAQWAPNWSAKVEYVHYDLGKSNYGASFGPITIGAKATTTDDVIKVGLNYKFGL